MEVFGRIGPIAHGDENGDQRTLFLPLQVVGEEQPVVHLLDLDVLHLRRPGGKRRHEQTEPEQGRRRDGEALPPASPFAVFRFFSHIIPLLVAIYPLQARL